MLDFALPAGDSDGDGNTPDESDEVIAECGNAPDETITTDSFWDGAFDIGNSLPESVARVIA